MNKKKSRTVKELLTISLAELSLNSANPKIKIVSKLKKGLCDFLSAFLSFEKILALIGWLKRKR